MRRRSDHWMCPVSQAGRDARSTRISKQFVSPYRQRFLAGFSLRQVPNIPQRRPNASDQNLRRNQLSRQFPSPLFAVAASTIDPIAMRYLMALRRRPPKPRSYFIRVLNTSNRDHTRRADLEHAHSSQIGTLQKCAARSMYSSGPRFSHP
jgi:hypothetical protein